MQNMNTPMLFLVLFTVLLLRVPGTENYKKKSKRMIAIVLPFAVVDFWVSLLSIFLLYNEEGVLLLMVYFAS